MDSTRDEEYIIKELLTLAKKAREYAYAPFSNYKVGAAVYTENNKYYTGCNIENTSFGATICAERVAMSKAISENGYIKITFISVYAQNPIPCGICRQFLSNFSYDETKVILVNADDKYKIMLFKELMPYPFTKLQ
ncbi:MAG: cytidine deaminase [Deferribacterota bacterium]|nr:cytidine deaminase [Deferribacterota bacterium]